MGNNSQKKFSSQSRIESFIHAFNGLKIALKEEPNTRIHLIISLVAIICGFVFKISIVEWIIICFAIGLVISMEIMNSAIESLCDFVSDDYHDLIKKVKDLAAAAVLISSIMSVVAGFLIFLPKIIHLINN